MWTCSLFHSSRIVLAFSRGKDGDCFREKVSPTES